MQKGNQLTYINCAYCPAQASVAKHGCTGTLALRPTRLWRYVCPCGHETFVEDKEWDADTKRISDQQGTPVRD